MESRRETWLDPGLKKKVLSLSYAPHGKMAAELKEPAFLVAGMSHVPILTQSRLSRDCGALRGLARSQATPRLPLNQMDREED